MGHLPRTAHILARFSVFKRNSLADGVEVRGNQLRVYFRYQGELSRATIPGNASPANLKPYRSSDVEELEAKSVPKELTTMKGIFDQYLLKIIPGKAARTSSAISDRRLLRKSTT
ncbi:hypothetical protein D3C81_465220 [compost metagenome]